MKQADISIDELQAALAKGGRAQSSDFDLNPAVTPRPDAKYRPASVLIPVIERPRGAQVILTRRAPHLKSHAGQVSFPGGKQDPDDASPLAAALREAHEEIGLSPHLVTILGSMAAHRTVTTFEVSPFVGQVDAGFRPVADLTEVAEIFEVPLGFLLHPDNFQIHTRIWSGQKRSFYAIPFGPHYIWGATARILRALAEQVSIR
jgi:8-oxo-dGTP pyrophosphatase MutT (NUDIX family)